MPQRFSQDQVRDPAQLYTLLLDMQRQIAATSNELARLRSVAPSLRPTASPVAQPRALDLSGGSSADPLTVRLTATSLQWIRDALSAGGVAELNVARLLGRLVEAQPTNAFLATELGALPSPALLDIGTLGLVVSAGPTYTLYYVAEGNPRTWSGAIPLAGGSGSGFVTLATDQDDISGRKTWIKLDDLNIVIRPVGTPTIAAQKWFLLGTDDGTPGGTEDLIWFDALGRITAKAITVWGNTAGSLKIKPDPDVPGGGVTLFEVYDDSEAVCAAIDSEGRITGSSSYVIGDCAATTFSGASASLTGHLEITATGGYIRILDYGGTLFPGYGYIYSYPGSPESNLAAVQGSLAMDTANGELYIKNTGSGNTGWKLVTHA